MKLCERTDSYTRVGVITHVQCKNVAVVVFPLPDDEVELCGVHWAEAVEAWDEVKK